MPTRSESIGKTFQNSHGNYPGPRSPRSYHMVTALSLPGTHLSTKPVQVRRLPFPACCLSLGLFSWKVKSSHVPSCSRTLFLTYMILYLQIMPISYFLYWRCFFIRFAAFVERRWLHDSCYLRRYGSPVLASVSFSAYEYDPRWSLCFLHRTPGSCVSFHPWLSAAEESFLCCYGFLIWNFLLWGPGCQIWPSWSDLTPSVLSNFKHL